MTGHLEFKRRQCIAVCRTRLRSTGTWSTAPEYRYLVDRYLVDCSGVLVPGRLLRSTGTWSTGTWSTAPEYRYLVDCSGVPVPGRLLYTVSDIPSQHHLRSATRHHLTVPRYWLSIFGRRAFSVAGLTVWNSLPDSLRDPTLTRNSFSQSLKTNLFCHYHSAQ